MRYRYIVALMYQITRLRQYNIILMYTKILSITLILCAIWTHDAFAKIHSSCLSDKIYIYTKPHCSYCVKMKNLLILEKLDYEERNISNNAMLQSWLYAGTSQKTVPYVFIGDKHVGGFTDFVRLCVKKHFIDFGFFKFYF